MAVMGVCPCSCGVQLLGERALCLHRCSCRPPSSTHSTDQSYCLYWQVRFQSKGISGCDLAPHVALHAHKKEKLQMRSLWFQKIADVISISIRREIK